MLDAIKPLLDNGIINEDTQQAITEAWEAKLAEARENLRTELREEFAQRYEHDKSVMVEALDRMVTESLSGELEQVLAEKQKLAEDRVAFKKKVKEDATKFNNFMVTKLAEEIKELRKDRQMHNEGLEKLEHFVIRALAGEIKEFAQDKKAVVETKVRLIREAKIKLAELKQRFVKESSARLSESVAKHLRKELSQLHEDIKIARENNFGRRIFEAYAAEFGATHLNEKAEVRKLRGLVTQKNKKLKESINSMERAKILIEKKEREIRMIRENNERKELMQDLLAPLNKEKQEVMRSLLESVQTVRLKNAFEKYLPAVLEDRRPVAKAKEVIAEGAKTSVVTGDKSAPRQDEDRVSNVIDLKRLAGL